jgi:hypothetical protein
MVYCSRRPAVAGRHATVFRFVRETVGRLVPFDYTVSFAYSGPGKPVCLHHTFGPKQFDIHVREYEIGPYLLDPFYKATANGIASGIHKLADLAPDQFYKSEYYKSYYVQTGPVDEIAFFISGKDGWVVVTSLMRAPSKPSFSAHDLRTLRTVEPLIRRIAETHWRSDERLKTASQVEDAKEVLRRTVQDALDARGMPPLTPRELQVVGLVLEGTLRNRSPTCWILRPAPCASTARTSTPRCVSRPSANCLPYSSGRHPTRRCRPISDRFCPGARLKIRDGVCEYLWPSSRLQRREYVVLPSNFTHIACDARLRLLLPR